jgi:hypothetical protein
MVLLCILAPVFLGFGCIHVELRKLVGLLIVILLDLFYNALTSLADRELVVVRHVEIILGEVVWRFRSLLA